MVMQPRVQLINKPTSPHTGIGRYATELERGLAERGVESARVPLRTPVPRAVASVARRAGYDLRTFFASYPLRATTHAGYLTHLTSQTLGGLLFTQRLPRPTVVTVHDILPYLLRNDPTLTVYRTRAQRLMDVFAMRGLRRADRLIADSHYTKSTLTDALGIRKDRIDVVHLGVDCQRFRPLTVPDTFRERYDLTPDRQYVLFVGSEDPRKNLPVLLNAMRSVRDTLPNAMLLKVGAAAFADQRQRHLRLTTELGISDAVRWFDDVSDEELPLFYNAANVFAFPSLYEGFGFPVLEAMACGTPVIAANASSVPELVGDVGTLLDETSGGAFAAAIIRVLLSPRIDPHALISQAALFSWSDTVRLTLASYATTAAVVCHRGSQAVQQTPYTSGRAER